ncbi:MAG: flagellar basal-body rod protein FlgC [Actinobacteria bacterium]|nr:flagellar basal-body rod protein FlgC [Actinomycetota bacterium]
MGLFDSISIARTGVTVYRTWLDAISDNIANINDATPTKGSAFQARFVLARPVANGAGAQVAGISYGSAAGRIVYEPGNPQADANGNVRYPDIDLGDQIGYLIMAQRGYQANLAVVDRAHDAYAAAIQLGKNA